MIIHQSAIQKNIEEIVHFTTNHGLLGILVEGAVLPNSVLKGSDKLAFIFQQNSEKRKERDPKWLDYVNLSISKVNSEFFSYSNYQHRYRDLFWAILSFTTELLDDPGVCFTTTNNIYPSCLRGQGLGCFNNMFAPSIEGYYQNMIVRKPTHLSSWTTCEQAEILYPNRLSLSYLQRIYVQDTMTKSAVMAQLAAVDKTFEVHVAPEKFK
jgi:hypothetical protein